ncbi:DUF485 domain-containing protein [Paraburkholderia susongensis]|uniref:Uncharacterized membrane protein, DUF485 family n=1 Tax=Paraburkholderia susongensis TaxID=1515439 RepID=A0A1X7M4K4_9BURK|nr:DUF485 domain-containing protein [Paraburkholderia susongensis]SMG60453.1 Uncharacterized membrane protein, DUF485 family [Paraburkholderia susongensis]
MEHPVPAVAGAAMESMAASATAAHPLLNDSRFRDLVRKRRTFAWSLTLLMLAIYFAFILTLAFSPKLLGTPIVSGEPSTWGIPVGFGMFVLTFALVAVYVHRANSVHDVIAAAIRAGDGQ